MQYFVFSENPQIARQAIAAAKAESAGAALVPGVKVNRVIMEDGACRGVSAGGQELTADCVVVTDGIRSELTEQLGQRTGFDIHDMGLGVKLLYKLDENLVNERFNLESGTGAAYGILGSVTRGIPGGGFLYTNKDSLSVGLVVHIDHLMESGASPYSLLQEMVANPEIARLVRGGEIVEYGAHMVSEGGKRNLPRSLCGDGWLITGDAAGFASNNGFNIRGMVYAAESGKLAALALKAAKSL